MAAIGSLRLPSIGQRAAALLVRPRPLWLLVALSFVIGSASALTMLPVQLIAGTGAFWAYPHGIFPNSQNDMASVLVGYLYFIQGGPVFPLLRAPLLGSAAGTNVFWLDVVPWVALLGKLVFAGTGRIVNLYGAYLFGCFALPGIAMTTLLAAAGQRSLVAAIAGTILTDETPRLLVGWGHISGSAHFFVIFALAFYLWSLRRPRDWPVPLGWLLLLVWTLLTNMYIFAMVGGVWLAGLVQGRLDGTMTARAVAAEGLAALAAIASVAAACGLLDRGLGVAGTNEYGYYSLNLLAPFLPAASVRLNGQYEGFVFLGLGVLMLLAATVRPIIFWFRCRWRTHVALIAVFCLFVAFAISNKVYLGRHLLFEIPLPHSALYALGTFRASARFFWPVGYAVVGLCTLLSIKNYRPGFAIGLLAAACVLQWVNTRDIRASIAASAAGPTPQALDRRRLAEFIAESRAVVVEPTSACVVYLALHGSLSGAETDWLERANLEVQLATAHAHIEVNSVARAHDRPTCRAETTLLQNPPQPGILYVYLNEFAWLRSRANWSASGDRCRKAGQVRYCRIPKVTTPRPPRI